MEIIKLGTFLLTFRFHDVGDVFFGDGRDVEEDER